MPDNQTHSKNDVDLNTLSKSKLHQLNEEDSRQAFERIMRSEAWKEIVLKMERKFKRSSSLIID